MAWRSIFLVLAAFAVFMILVFWWTIPDPTPRQRSGARISALLGRHDLWIVFVLWVVSGTSVMVVYNIVPLFLVDEKGMSVETANRFLSLSRLGGDSPAGSAYVFFWIGSRPNRYLYF
jgi:predicted MFS family arabinose efflux permease